MEIAFRLTREGHQRFCRLVSARVDSPVLAESRLRLVGDGLEATGAHATTKYAWHGIKKLTETADLVVIWIDRALGIVVPKRAFASDEACRSFVDTVRAHHKPAERQV